MKVVGVTFGWDLKPHLCFEGGTYLYGNADKILYPEYWPNGINWPINPKTGEELPAILGLET